MKLAGAELMEAYPTYCSCHPLTIFSSPICPFFGWKKNASTSIDPTISLRPLFFGDAFLNANAFALHQWTELWYAQASVIGWPKAVEDMSRIWSKTKGITTK